jgi:formimidoylglutamate deiminase
VSDHFTSKALLPTGWGNDVRLVWDGSGALTEAVAAETHASGSSMRSVVLPGVPNLHSHAFQRAMAGLTERRGVTSDSFWSWRERMYAFLAHISPDDAQAIAAQLYVEMLKAGYTAVAEFHYLHNDLDGRPYADPAEMSRRMLAAANEAGISITLLPVAYQASDFGGVPLGDPQKRFRMDAEALATLIGSLSPELSISPKAGPVRRLGVALHSLRAVPPEALADVLAAAKPLGSDAPIHIHVAEQRREVEACIAWSGARPVEWLLDHAPVDERWCLVHATHVTDDELAAMAGAQCVAGLCPTTEANLGDGIFPLGRFLELGGVLGIGSDSHTSVSPVEELRWVEYGQRLSTGARNVAAGFPHASTGRTLVENALAGGTRALGMPIGEIAPTRRADFVSLDAEHPALVGREDDALVDSWIFSGNESPIRQVVVGGVTVVEDGHHPREEEILDRYRKVVKRLVRDA